jgi:hypothetical protein
MAVVWCRAGVGDFDCRRSLSLVGLALDANRCQISAAGLFGLVQAKRRGGMFRRCERHWPAGAARILEPQSWERASQSTAGPSRRARRAGMRPRKEPSQAPRNNIG